MPVFSTHEGTDEFGNVGQSLMIKCSSGHDEVQPWEGMSNEVYGNLRDKTASTMATEKIAVNFIPGVLLCCGVSCCVVVRCFALLWC